MPQQPKHAVVILAAGSSRRLGRDKAGLQRADGSSFLDHVVAAAQATAPLLTLVVRRPEQTLPMTAVVRHSVQRIDCADADEGMSASLRCGLRAVPASAEGVLILLLDQPALDAAHLLHLVQTWQQRPEHAVASVYSGVRGAPAMLPRHGLAALSEVRGDIGARHWLRTQRNVIELPCAALAQDVDRVGDWVQDALDTTSGL